MGRIPSPCCCAEGRRILKKTIATLGWVGYSPIAPGTAGTAVTAALYGLLLCLGVRLEDWHWTLILGVLGVLGVYCASAAEKELGRDPGPVVIDEAFGYTMTVAWLPQNLTVAAVAFLLFRVLDIIKPPPARWSESLPGGWGIMVDDGIAGLYGNLLIRTVLYGLSVWGAS